jgi:hypothetical protein
MKYDNCSGFRITGAVQAPIMPGVVGFDRYIVDILIDDGKIV